MTTKVQGESVINSQVQGGVGGGTNTQVKHASTESKFLGQSPQLPAGPRITVCVVP